MQYRQVSFRIKCIIGFNIALLVLVPSFQRLWAADDANPVSIKAHFFSDISLENISAGAVGRGILVYYQSDGNESKPRIAVLIEKAGTHTPATAKVFVPPADGHGEVLLDKQDGVVLVSEDSLLAVELEAVDGWWVRDGIVNYNLDITVYGQTAAMWGSTANDDSAAQVKWPRLLAPGEPNAQITVRDTNGDGLPDWDWRTMLPEFPNRSDYRTNYAESKCITPVEADLGVSPQWPFIAFEGGFEQELGRFRPPIVVNWETGQVEYFSELVTVRNQNCSYSLYSISRVEPGELNHPNFESPFAFYDLSGEGVGYPNLLLRTQRTVEDDVTLFLEDNPETQSIRYSWRNEVGDRRWDYKVEVLGQHQYAAQTPIAGGAALIDAPDYEAFPSWVIEREWPIAIFIGTEQGGDYRSSEGIYEWSPLGLSEEFFFGWTREPDLSGFHDIRLGLRGEYRLNSTRKTQLYLSPIDNRLHLKGAEHGIWRLSREQIIRVTNINNDETIDVWSREVMPIVAEEDLQLEDIDNREPAISLAEQSSELQDTIPESEIIEEIYALDQYLIHHDEARITIVATQYDPVLLETLPPTDRTTWLAHKNQLEPYLSQRRDPTDLRSWLDAFPGPRSEMSGISISNVRFTEGGFRFELIVEDGYQLSGADILGNKNLRPGSYLVTNDGTHFTISPLIPPSLSIRPVTQLDNRAHNGATSVWIVVENTGLADARDMDLIVAIEDGKATSEEYRVSIDVQAGDTFQTLINLPIDSENSLNRYVWIENKQGEQLTEKQVLEYDKRGLGNRALAPLQILSWSQALAFVTLIVCILVLMVVAARTMLVNGR